MIIEIIGYIASVLVAISLTMSSLIKLRLINLIGATIFVIYGFLLPTYPVIAVNAFIAVVNIYYLVEAFSSKEYFDILEVPPNSPYKKKFLEFYEKDIHKFFPDFSLQDNGNYYSLFILRNMVPSSLVVIEKNKDGSYQIILDYVAPSYRDFKVGRFLYKKNLAYFIPATCLQAKSNCKSYQKYLLKMGFQKSGDSTYVLPVTAQKNS